MIWKIREFNGDLAAAVEGFDRDKAAKLCDNLIEHLRDRDDPFPEDGATDILGLLRGKRYFDLMQSVADVLIQNEQAGAKVRRLYAQSQLDQGNLTAAISTLVELELDTAPKGKTPNPVEYAEARGLLGRAYKDRYIQASNPARSRNRRSLENSIEYYRGIYKDDSSKVWQGINGVALIRRAEKDGVELDEITAPKLLADTMATQILMEVKNRHIKRKADTWDFATAVEACIGLGQYDEALEWLRRYIESDYTDAFELGSTYRQLTQVWQLNTTSDPGDKILPALKAALLKQQGSNIEISVEEAVHETLNELAEDAGYQKILGTDGFKSFKWFQKCMQRAKAVAQVEDSVGDAIGTAFLVRGGDLKPEYGDELLLLTNAHVVSTNPLVSDALRPEKAVLRFELWSNEVPPEFKVEQLWTSPPDEFDATLLRPIPAISGVEPVPIVSYLPVINENDEEKLKSRAYIIGHPSGRKLSFSIHDNYLLDADDRLLHYRSPTEPGSSGSPVFNEDWDLIGLHHKGLKRMPRLNGKAGTYPANEGVWIQAIVNKCSADTGS